MRSNPLTALVLAFVLAAMVPSSRASEQYQALLQQASRGFEKDYRESWAFTEERSRAGITWLGRWDPRHNKRWTLLSVDGHEPTDKERSKYQHDKAEELKRGRGRSQSPDTMVAPGSMTLVSQDASAWHFRFQPTGEGDSAAVMRYLQGNMTIQKSGPEITMIEVHSTGNFKPKFGFTVHEFLSRFEFERIQNGPMVPMRLDFHIVAKAMGLMNINDRVTVHYRDYEKVRDPGVNAEITTTGL